MVPLNMQKEILLDGIDEEELAKILELVLKPS